MERYGWMILLGILAIVALIFFFLFLFSDLERVKKTTLAKKSLVWNGTLFLLAAICIVLAIYFYFDIENQLKILERI